MEITLMVIPFSVTLLAIGACVCWFIAEGLSCWLGGDERTSVCGAAVFVSCPQSALVQREETNGGVSDDARHLFRWPFTFHLMEEEG